MFRLIFLSPTLAYKVLCPELNKISSITGILSISRLGKPLVATLVTVFMLLFSVSCGDGHGENAIEEIRFSAPNLYPQGIAFDQHTDRVLVSSLKQGQIGMVDRHRGAYNTFIEDKMLFSTVGISVDTERRRLFVANANVKDAKYLGVAVYDLDDKTKLAYFELSKLYPDVNAAHFPGEIELDAQGNVYVSDSLSPAIYKISSDLRVAELWLNNPPEIDWSGEQRAIGFTGLALINPRRKQPTLMVAKYNTGELFAVNIVTKEITKVSVSAELDLHSIAGMSTITEEQEDFIMSHQGTPSVVAVLNEPGKEKIVLIGFDRDGLQVNHYEVVNNLPQYQDLSLEMPSAVTLYDEGFLILNSAFNLASLNTDKIYSGEAELDFPNRSEFRITALINNGEEDMNHEQMNDNNMQNMKH